MAMNRRGFLGASGMLAAGAMLGPLLRSRRARAAGTFATEHLVVVGIAGGLRNSEALGMAQGATMPNLLGNVPLISGFGSAAGAVRIAPEYAAAVRPLVVPAPRATPLYTEGALITNLRYAEGAPGHLQGQACLMSGYYNNLENRADARLPVPTIFEIHRRMANAPATDAWYVSVLGGFYRALQASENAGFGPRFGASFFSPPGVATPLVPVITSGKRTIEVGGAGTLPVIPYDPEEDAAVARLRGVLDGDYPAPEDDRTTFRATAEENAALREHLAAMYSDDTYGSFFPDSFGIGLDDGNGGIDQTADALTVYHAERILERFTPSVLGLTLIDIDACHTDFNGYLRGQQIADACVAHLWDFIQSTDGLRDKTTMIVLPEHGRHLYMNGQNPDSLGRSGIDHGEGDDGDRDVWMMMLGPDVAPVGAIEPTGVSQSGRTSGRYETIDAIMTGMTLLGHGERMAGTLSDFGARPGLTIGEVLR